MQSKALNSHKHIQLMLAVKLSIYLLIMITVFAAFYFLLGKHIDASQHGIYREEVAATCLEALYFSVVTITTLGYGDFTPLGASRFFATAEALAGLLFAGYSISQVLSVKQDATIEYLLKAEVIRTYAGLLDNVKDAKEEILDHHRINRRQGVANIHDLNLYHGNPLYPSVIALQKLNGYTKHIESIGILDEIEEYLNRAATQVEELSSMIRKYVNFINAHNESEKWQTTQSNKALKEISKSLEHFLDFAKHSRYQSDMYKGHAKYDVIINKIITDLRMHIS